MSTQGATDAISPAGTAPVAAAAVALLDQCAALLEQVPESSYRTDSRLLAGGTIGKHLRHCLDHYKAALDGRRDGAVVQYDRRERGGDIEHDRSAALDEILTLRNRLAGVREADLADPMRVRFMITGDGAESEFETTFGREVAFAGHHAVHHFAMIKAIASEHGVVAPDGFGKAPSTINHEAEHV